MLRLPPRSLIMTCECGQIAPQDVIGKQTATANKLPSTPNARPRKNTHDLWESEALSLPRKPECVLLPLLVEALLAVRLACVVVWQSEAVVMP